MPVSVKKKTAKVKLSRKNKRLGTATPAQLEKVKARNESQARFRLQKNKLGNLAETREELKHVQMELDYAQSKLAHAEEEFKHKQAQLDITHDQI